MSGGFFERWSQRKLSEKERQEEQRQEQRHAAGSDDRAEEPLESGVRGNQPQESLAAPQQEEMLSEEELAALPSLDSITTQTDLRQFLRKGVPGALKNAALRKMWLLDPAIRNHVDYAVDYAWDWNVPGGVPGHGGQIAGESVAKMLDKLLPEPVSNEAGTLSKASSELPAVMEEATDETLHNRPTQFSGPHADDAADRSEAGSGIGVDESNLPPQQVAQASQAPDPCPKSFNKSDPMSRTEDRERPRPRRHGGALPT